MLEQFHSIYPNKNQFITHYNSVTASKYSPNSFSTLISPSSFTCILTFGQIEAFDFPHTILSDFKNMASLLFKVERLCSHLKVLHIFWHLDQLRLIKLFDASRFESSHLKCNSDQIHLEASYTFSFLDSDFVFHFKAFTVTCSLEIACFHWNFQSH